MRFNKRFERRKGVVAPLTIPLIGSDGTAGAANPPTQPPNSSRDNVLCIKGYSSQGWPCHRIAVTYRGTGGTALPCELWIYDHLTEAWYLLEASKTLNLNTVTFFDVVALLDSAALNATLTEPGSGGIEVFLKIQDNALPDGVYIFGIGADLTPLAV